MYKLILRNEVRRLGMKFFFLFQSLVKYIYVNVKNIYLETLN